MVRLDLLNLNEIINGNFHGEIEATLALERRRVRVNSLVIKMLTIMEVRMHIDLMVISLDLMSDLLFVTSEKRL